jgi:hypothetical protein
VLGWREYTRASYAKQRAESEATLAERRRDAALTRVSQLDAEIARRKAEIANLAKVASSYAATDAKGSTLRAAKGSTDKRIAAVTGGDPQAIPPRVYICIPNERFRERAKHVASRLQQAGYIVPFIELVRDDPLATTLKYFSSDTLAADETTKVATLLAEAGVTVRVRPMEPEETTTDFRPRHYELWFSSHD